MKKLKSVWNRLRVYFGFGVWVKEQWNRPKFSRCAYHGIKMKRQRKTPFGAFYWCPLCKRHYHLDSKGNKLVPA